MIIRMRQIDFSLLDLLMVIANIKTSHRVC